MQWLQSVFEQAPEIALFLSLAGGYALGKIHFGKFQLGGVAGSLLVAVVISQVGVHIDNGVKAVLFALFIMPSVLKADRNSFGRLGVSLFAKLRWPPCWPSADW